MLINFDYSYISTREQQLNDAGYGTVVAEHIWFDRHFTEEERERNWQFSQSMSKEEWERHNEAYNITLNSTLEEIVNILLGKFNIQDSHNDDYDFYFWSDSGTIAPRIMTRFSLTFNRNRSLESRENILSEVLAILKEINCEGVVCRIQFRFYKNEVKIEEEATEIYKSIEGKFVTYLGKIGKVKIVSEGNGQRVYGFFKKGAKSRYYRISAEDIIFSCK